MAPQSIPSSLEIHPSLFNWIHAESRILDMGCGNGATIFELYHRGYHHVSGLDFNRSAITACARQCDSLPVDLRPAFYAADARNMPFTGATFDCIISKAFWTTIVDDVDRSRVMAQVSRVLDDAGILYIADFDQNWDDERYRLRYEDGIASGRSAGTFAVQLDTTGELLYWARHSTRSEFESLLRDNGLLPIRYTQLLVKTRTGSQINGHLIIGQKLTHLKKLE